MLNSSCCIHTQKRAAVIQRAKANLDHDEGWTRSQKHFGVATYYKRQEDGSVSLKLECELSGVPLFEQVAVLREVDLNYKWAPFCTSSMTVKNLDKLDTIGWAVVGLPKFGFARDACVRAFGCDCMMEDGSFLLVGQGINDRPPGVPYDEPYFLEGMEGVNTPETTTRIGFGRMTVRSFSSQVQIESPTSVKSRLVANINPNLALVPQPLLDFVMRRICGVVFHRLQLAAQKAVDDPIRNPHAQRMRQQQEFYRDWLMPKFQAYCDQLGWTMPPVAAFNVTEEELALAESRHSNGFYRRPPPRCLSSTAGMESAVIRMSVHSIASAPELQYPVVETDSSDAHADTSDANSTSDASGTSMKTMLRDNPIVQYLREIEIRTQRQKMLKIEEERKNMAMQLRPHTISHEDFVRLQQLKRAKARRQRREDFTVKQQTPSDDEGICDETVEVDSHSFTDRFHTHGRLMRFIMTFVLGTVLLVTLYSDRLLNFDSHLRKHAESMWMNVFLDIATVLYLIESAAVFFILSFVSLVYAFDALDIGMKSGRRSKEYYGEKISHAVAGISGGIVALSAGKAIASVWIRVTLWYSLKAIRFMRREFEHGLADQIHLAWFLDHMPEAVKSGTATILPHISPIVRNTVSTSKSVVLFIQHWFVVIVIRSNSLGRALAALTLRLFGVFAYLAVAWEKYMARVVDMYSAEDVTLASWRGTAIDTARPLLAYAAVFLVTLLTLFNATAPRKQHAQQSVKKEEVNKKEAPSVSVSFGAQVEGLKDEEQTSVSVSFDDFPPVEPMVPPPPTPVVTTPTRRFSRQDYSSITQESMCLDGSDSIATSGSMDTPLKKRFRRLRRLRKKKSSTSRVMDDASIQSSLTGASPSKMKTT